jgi:serine/threonine-protein kinase
VANVAAGQHAAHELEDSDGTKLRVVHRDVSPQNILISKNGHVKVADFGVAKAQGQLHRPTETGEMKGKLAYMAPEQVTAKDIDHRADIFALGCVLYEVTVGRRPFHGEGALSTLYQLLEQSVTSPTEILPGYPVDLADIVLKALAKDPAQRYQTAEELRVALEGWITTCGSAVSEREIAALMRTTLGGEIDDKQRRINDATAKLKDRPIEGNAGLQHSRNSEPTNPDGQASRRREGAITEDRGVATGNVREKSSWWLPVGAAAAVLALVAVLAKGTLGTDQATTPAPEPAAASTPPPTIIIPSPSLAATARPSALDPEPSSRPETQQVKITVRTIPAHARIRIDDGEPVTTPFTVEQAASKQLRQITASAPSYTSVTRQVSFDQSQEIVLELERASSHRQPARRPRAASSEPTPAAQNPEPAPVKPRDPSTPGKRPRTLDEANPFAG